MGRVRLEELSEAWGYRFGIGRGYEIYVCPDCVREEELRDLRRDEMLTGKDVEENDIVFCDRCKKQMQ